MSDVQQTAAAILAAELDESLDLPADVITAIAERLVKALVANDVALTDVSQSKGVPSPPPDETLFDQVKRIMEEQQRRRDEEEKQDADVYEEEKWVRRGMPPRYPRLRFDAETQEKYRKIMETVAPPMLTPEELIVTEYPEWKKL